MLTINKTGEYKAILNYEGEMRDQYSPLQNLVSEETSILGDFTTKKLDFDLEHPVDIILQDSYDGSVNMILNDNKNPSKLINSRFSIQDENRFIIPDHTGFKDTNVYDETTFEVDTDLKPIPLKIPKIKFNGLLSNHGKLACGSYTFYFKLADADGNESEIVAESGIVQMHIGNNNSPSEARMGMEDENTNKAVSFTVSNIDSGFDYIHVLFVRSSSGNSQATTNTYRKVVFDYPVVNSTCEITITGNEYIQEIDEKQLYVDYIDLQSVKTQAVFNNVLMFGNNKKPIHDWDELRRISWKIIPRWHQKANVGHIDTDYKDSGTINEEENKLCYYNDQNIYYRVGYWPDEIYRFGIVYIFKDNSLSPVFNLQGIDFSTIEEKEMYEDNYYQKFFEKEDNAWECEPEDCYFKPKYKTNSRGVIKFPKLEIINQGSESKVVTPSPLYISFDIREIWRDSKYNEKNPGNESYQKVLEYHNIKGFFFVRQKRIPTILGQGLVIAHSKKDYGSLPVLKDEGNRYLVESFLDKDRILKREGTFITPQNKRQFDTQAMLVPDAEVCEATYNQIFVGNEFCLTNAGRYIFSGTNSVIKFNELKKRKDKVYLSKLLNIPENTKILTNGDDYFSTLAGNEHEPYKTSDIEKDWNQTAPQNLTASTTLLRGNWGPYVGLSNPTPDKDCPLVYGEIYNIKQKIYYDDEEQATLQDFQKRFNSAEEYHAISDRSEIQEETDCYRGDCFINMFTHRMYRNFIDPELPTNHDIVDPSCWSKNYGVRCTAQILENAHSNLLPDTDGWEIPAPTHQKWIQPLIYFLTGNFIGGIIAAVNASKTDAYPNFKLDKDDDYYLDDDGNLCKHLYVINENGEASQQGHEIVKYYGDPTNYPYGYANEIVQAFEVYVGSASFNPLFPINSIIKLIKAASDQGLKKKVNPHQQEVTGAFNLKAIFKADEDWELRGLASINRADVNAVALGQWITFPIMSSHNLSFRDIDYSNATEQASFNKKRSFFPLEKKNKYLPLRDSNVINSATAISIPDKKYYALPNVPFIKQEYFTRVYHSQVDNANSFTNEFKVMFEYAYRDYTKIYGSITKLVPFGNYVYIVFQHGIGRMDVTSSMSKAQNPYELLPYQIVVVSDYLGSIWKDSIINTQIAIYGVDSIAKCIWSINQNGQISIISNQKVEKFLIDNLDMSEFTTTPYIGHINIKTHYNAFKRDVIFTYYNDIPLDAEAKEINRQDLRDNPNIKITSWKDGLSWSLCWNEVLQHFQTFYDWIPIESENIDNIFFTFDREKANELALTVRNDLIPSNYKEHYSVRKSVIDDAFIYKTTVYEGDGLMRYGADLKADTLYAISFYIKAEELSILDIIMGDFYRMEIQPSIDDKWSFIVIYTLPTFEDIRQFEFDFGGKFSISEFKITELDTNTTFGASVLNRVLEAQVAVSCHLLKETPKESEGELPLIKNNEFLFLRNNINGLEIWKHGQAGIYDNQGKILPTNWYGKQHEFNFEFIVNTEPQIQKIFDNLKLIGNKAEPMKFEYEVVGEGYEWYEYKDIIYWANIKALNDQLPTETYDEALQKVYYEILSHNLTYLYSTYQDFPTLFNKKGDYIIPKLPYFKIDVQNVKGTKDQIDNINKDPEKDSYKDNSSSSTLVEDEQLNEYKVHTESLGNDIKKYGRTRGNMEYLEDLWDVEIRPIYFKNAFIKDDKIEFSKLVEARYRDKFLRVKVRYSGKDLVIVQAILTMYNYSFA